MTQSIKEGQKPSKKHRTSPVQFVGQVEELGDVMSSVSAADWGQIESIGCSELANLNKNA